MTPTLSMPTLRRRVDDVADERVASCRIRGPDGVARRVSTVFRAGGDA